MTTIKTQRQEQEQVRKQKSKGAECCCLFLVSLVILSRRNVVTKTFLNILLFVSAPHAAAVCAPGCSAEFGPACGSVRNLGGVKEWNHLNLDIINLSFLLSFGYDFQYDWVLFDLFACMSSQLTSYKECLDKLGFHLCWCCVVVHFRLFAANQI